MSLAGALWRVLGCEPSVLPELGGEGCGLRGEICPPHWPCSILVCSQWERLPVLRRRGGSPRILAHGAITLGPWGGGAGPHHFLHWSLPLHSLSWSTPSPDTSLCCFLSKSAFFSLSSSQPVLAAVASFPLRMEGTWQERGSHQHSVLSCFEEWNCMQAVSRKEGLLEGSSMCTHIRCEDMKCQSQPRSLKVYGKERRIEDRASLRSDSGKLTLS